MARKGKSYHEVLASESGFSIFKKATEHDYWRYEYSRRKFYLDLKKQFEPGIAARSSLGCKESSDPLKSAQAYVVQRCNGVYEASNFPFRICDCSELSWNRPFLHHWILSALVQRYSEELHDGDPKFRLDSPPKLHMILYYYGIYRGFDEFSHGLEQLTADNPLYFERIANKILRRMGDNRDDLIWLYNKSKKYGYFPWQMILMGDVLEGLRFFDEKGVPPCLCEEYLREDDPLDSLGVSVHFADENQRQFYVEENSRDAFLYLYFKVLDVSKSIKFFVNVFEEAVYRFHKKKKGNPYGEKDGSNIQIVINMKNFDFSKMKDIRKLIEIQFVKYRHWISPDEHILDRGQIDILRTISVTPSEQTPFRSRSLGLWLWDQVHLYGRCLDESMEEAFQVDCFKLDEDVERVSLFRRFKLAEMCVADMAVLNFRRS